LVDYKNAKINIKIICKIHGIFEQLPTHHLKGSGCPKCANSINSNNQRKTKVKFIEEANKIHNNKYDYSLVEYINDKTKIIIICKIHGIFGQQPNNHLQGNGCKLCSGNYKKTTEEFIIEANKIHNNKYDYSLVEYINAKNKVKIICKIHGMFEQIAYCHLIGNGCALCKFVKISDVNRKTKEKFIEEGNIIHKNIYDYSLVEYINSNTKIKIICKIHGIFEQKPTNHLYGKGCSLCVNKTEGILNEYLVSIFPDTISQYKVDWCKNPKTNQYLRYDFFIPSLNIIIELDGLQHFQQVSNWGDTYETQKRDKYKLQKALENNIIVIRLLQDDVFNDKIDWKGKLKDVIIKYEEPEVVLLVEDESIYDYLFEKEDVIETLDELTKTINHLRDELNKLPELVIEKTITDMEDYENRFNNINDELTRLENVRENIYEDFIRSL
jgi:very-short-patch-repair endonuclease